MLYAFFKPTKYDKKYTSWNYKLAKLGTDEIILSQNQFLIQFQSKLYCNPFVDTVGAA
jgi:hypothetical protein